MRIAVPLHRTSWGLAGLALLVAGVPAQAKTCTVDLDQLRQIRADVTSLVKDAHVDRERVKGLAGKYLAQLQTGKLVVDKQDLKAVAPPGRRPPAAAMQQLLAEIQGVVKSCEASAAGDQ